MRRLRVIDIALLTTLVPLWLVAVTLHAVQASRDRIAWPPLYVSSPASAEDYPVLRGALAGSQQDLAVGPGDRLLRVGDFDLRGVGPVRFAVESYAASDAEFRIPLEYARGDRTGRVLVPFARRPYPLRTLPLVLATGLMSGLILLRGRGSVQARAIFAAGMAHGLQWSVFAGPVPWQSYLSLGIVLTSVTLFGPFLLRALLLFPANVAPRTALGRGWPIVFCVWGPATTSWLFGYPLASDTGLLAIFTLNILLASGALFVITRNYRRTDRAGRRQLKWVLYGFYVGFVPVAVGAGLAAADPALTWVYEVCSAATVLIPICVVIAVVRDDFLDIDRLITETASYTVVVLVLLACLVQVIPAGARLLSETAGIAPGAAQALLFVAIAGVMVPVRRFVAPYAESLFYRERAALERDLQRLRDELGRLDDPGKLFKRLGEQLSALLGLESCVIYAGTGSSLEPVFALASPVPVVFPAKGEAETLIEAQDGPISAVRWRRWVRSGALRGAEAASLETVQPELILPIHGDEHLVAFVCLGAKRSGDVYTKSELAWLAALADRAARQLLRFGDAEIIRHGRELRQKLARYVPRVIAERIEQGREVEPREQEVTILFADIRGYTSLSEGRDAEEIFSIVSLYAETVSGIITRHDGSVVEVHGDGVLAAFGAPDALPRKEESAVRAAREIVLAVGRLSAGGEQLAVGVGVATGPAFVGNIEATDRVIWGAIGNTTTLAARLQVLTRELGASIATDAATRKAAGSEVSGFRRHAEVNIRGRSEPHEVWTLPQAVASGLD